MPIDPSGLTLEQVQAEIERRKTTKAQSQQSQAPQTLADLLGKVSPILKNTVVGGLQGLAGQTSTKAAYRQDPYSTEYAKQAAKAQFPKSGNDLDDTLKRLKIEQLSSPNVNGYESESQIPPSAGGVPLKSVSVKNGRYVPTYQKSAGTEFGGSGEDTRTPQEVMDSLSEQHRALVKKVMNYEVDPRSIPGMSNQTRTQILGLASSLDPSYDMTKFPTVQDYRKQYSGGKIGGNIRSFNTAIQHLGELNDVLPSVPSSGMRMLEQAQRGYAKNFDATSDAAIGMTKEDASITAVAGELANIFKNSGGTDQEIEKWFHAYDKDAPRESKQAFIQQGLQLMQGRLNAIDSDWTRVVGKPYESSIVSPESQATIDRLQQSGGSSGGSTKRGNTFRKVG